MSFRTLEESVLGTINRTIGSDWIYSPAIGDDVSIKAVFENSWVTVGQVTSIKPTLRIQLSDLAAKPAKNDTVSSETEGEFKVLESREDGYGGSTLILQKV